MKKLLLSLVLVFVFSSSAFVGAVECISGNCQNGYGTYLFDNGDKYVGEWKNDVWNGQGTYTYADGAKYVGEFKDGLTHGQGTFTYADGAKYVGEYKNGEMNGQGTFTYADETIKRVIWKNGEFIEKKEDKFDPLKLAELIDRNADLIDGPGGANEATPSLYKKGRLSLNDEAAIRAQFMYCWSLDAGRTYDDTDIVSIKIFLNIDGSQQKPPEIIESHRNRMAKPDESRYKILAKGALRAVRRCDPLTTVPNIDEYDMWKELQLNFDPREKLR